MRTAFGGTSGEPRFCVAGSAATFIALFLLSILAACDAAPSPGPQEYEVLRRIEAARLEALVEADAEVMERLHAADFELVNPYGEVYSRAEYLSQIISGQLNYTAWEPGEMSFRAFANAAVIRYKDKDFEAEFDGEVVSRGRLYHTNLYEKREGSGRSSGLTLRAANSDRDNVQSQRTDRLDPSLSCSGLQSRMRLLLSRPEPGGSRLKRSVGIFFAQRQRDGVLLDWS